MDTPNTPTPDSLEESPSPLAPGAPPPGPAPADLTAELAATRQEAAKYRRQVRDLEAKVQAHTAAQLTEAEQLQQRLKDAETRAAALATEIRTARLESAVTRLSGKLQIVDPDAAFRLMDHSTVEWGDDERPVETSVQAALKALATARPYLVAPAAAAPTGGAPTTPPKGGGPALTRAEIERMSSEERIARWPEIERFLANYGK